jgi:DegT/DnrJ/EryC1/StrS aminotransferase family
MRMSNLNAALGLAHLERIDEFIARNRRRRRNNDPSGGTGSWNTSLHDT